VFSLFFDEDAQEHSLIRSLRRAGFDCLTANEAGRQGLSDEEQLSFAAAARRVLYTRNTKDFARLHAVWRRSALTHAGVIVVTHQRVSIGLRLRALQNMAAIFESDDMANRLEFLLNYA
jgi:uncharacterized protein with PIN domain